jgi:hypothetical protein
VNDLADVLRVYTGSDGDATKALYAQLCELGIAGAVAMNVFRAMKCSERAKVYRGGDRHGSYRHQAYHRKQWSMDLLTGLLEQHADDLGIAWGWSEDPRQECHRYVLYIDLPTGQVSFHTDKRGVGPAYPGQWDGARDRGPDRICRWCARLLGQEASIAS